MPTRWELTIPARRVHDAHVTTPLPDRVAQEIRAELARRNMSQAALAEAIGKTEMYVSMRISGRSARRVVLDIADLELIAGALGLPASHFLADAA